MEKDLLYILELLYIPFCLGPIGEFVIISEVMTDSLSIICYHCCLFACITFYTVVVGKLALKRLSISIGKIIVYHPFNH